jgi:phytanoyl-CoA hydroxylase
VNASPLKTSFDLNGFVHLPGYLSDSKRIEVESRLEEYLEKIVPRLEPGKAIYEGKGSDRILKQLVDMQIEDSFFNALLHDPIRIDLVSELLGEPAIARTVEFFGKPPLVGTPTPPHQDGYYFCLKPNHALTVWIALDKCDLENGCIHYVRGSHLNGLVEHLGSGVPGFSQGVQSMGWSNESSVQMQVAAGDALIHHSLTIHYTDANGSERPRRALGLVYFAESAQRDPESWNRYQKSFQEQQEASV